MRIIIDTELQMIIVPDSYKHQVDKLNEIITECGGRPLDYTRYIRTCFEKAYSTQIIRQSDLPSVKGTKKRRAAEAPKEPFDSEEGQTDRPESFSQRPGEQKE